MLGKCHIIADSFHVLSLLEEAAASQGLKLAVGLRIHPDFTMDGMPQMPSKFGIDESFVWETAFEKEYPHLTIDGLHVHIRSQVLDTEQLGRYYDNMMGLAVRLQKFLDTKLEQNWNISTSAAALARSTMQRNNLLWIMKNCTRQLLPPKKNMQMNFLPNSCWKAADSLPVTVALM